MNIKILIGQRISEARKNLGLSQVQLSQLTGFGKARLSNWETGFRTPKLEEAKILEKHLHVPASFLLCLTDEKTFPENFGISKVTFKSIPLFREIDLHRIDQIVQMELYKTKDYLPVYPGIDNRIGQNFFAFQLFDDSMSPVYNKHDIIVFDPNQKAHHNDEVLVKVRHTNEILFRKLYIDNSTIEASKIELRPINNMWLSTKIDELSNIIFLGVASYEQRIFT
ncbi:TPA: helix-turn-helix domain-containing protein [Legionella feeleii]